jgi:UDP-N-acetylglucosamine--N-acetylmuramyl-(pentapeptide) pyrophosphoryl-undecaprenol N-acetylglucosamine transferase
VRTCSLEEVLPELLSRTQVVHQCREASIDRLRAVRDTLPAYLAACYRVLPFVGAELSHLYAGADIVPVVSHGSGHHRRANRAGETQHPDPTGPTGGDERRRNKWHVVDSGAAVCLTGSGATAGRLLDALFALFDDPAAR